jgi:tryptophan 2,3-dioxygenase
VDYSTYLGLPGLLALASPRSTPEHPDELFFIVTHQAIELYFRVLAEDVRRARDLIDADELAEAVVLVRRLSGLVGVCLSQLSALEHLPVESFRAFRHHLGTASGLQSVQFRELEVLSGLRHDGYQERISGIFGGRVPAPVERALSEPSLADAHRAAGARRDVRWAGFFADPRRDPRLDRLSRALLDYDEAWRRWRGEHVALVLRMLGAGVPGTAGRDTGYLSDQVHRRFFPHLAEALPAGAPGTYEGSAVAAARSGQATPFDVVGR